MSPSVRDLSFLPISFVENASGLRHAWVFVAVLTCPDGTGNIDISQACANTRRDEARNGTLWYYSILIGIHDTTDDTAR